MAEIRKYTLEGLPIVSENTISAYIAESVRDLRQVTRDYQKDLETSALDFIVDSLMRMQQQNPSLAEIIKDMINGTAIKEWSPQQAFIHGAFFVYDCLRRQAEASRLEERS